MSFVHLQVQSAFSLLSSTASVEQLVKEAKEKGFTMLALTDYNVMHGAVTFYKQCLKHEIKPIIGLTVDVQSEITSNKAYPLVLLAKNQAGFQNLMKISSVVQTKSKDGIPLKWLRHYATGLFGISPGREGEIESYLIDNEEEKAAQGVKLFKHIFGEDSFYLSLQNHAIPVEVSLLNKVVSLANSYSVQTVVTNDVRYLQQSDSFAHECLLAIKNGEKLQDDERERLETDQYYLKTSSEIIELFSDFPEALENAWRIAEECNVMVELHKQKLPKYPTLEGETAEGLLEKLCSKGLTERYGHVTEEHKNRLRYELSVIKKMKFADYFLIVWDFMRFSRDQHILTGPGRGSAAGSLVSYVLYITDVDPLQYDLLFERFLNPERITMPDIDIDFPDHRRDEVIEYVANKYGEAHVAQIVTFGTLAAKAALRDVGRAFGLNTKELEGLSRTVPSQLGISLKDAYAQSERLRAFVNESASNQRLFETAVKLEGLPRHTSTHAAGVVISEEPLVNTVPISEGSQSVYVTQFAMDDLEEVGLLKMDFLGLRNLTLIESIIDLIKKRARIDLNIKAIPLDDKETFSMLSLGETTGVFQLESEGMRNVLKRLKPSSFEDIVAVNALYRPGPMEHIPMFINRKHGKETILYLHEDLKPILEKTYGIIVYQEQIMQIASTMAGFSLGEADLLRRAVGKKKKEILDKERQHFVEGAMNKGYEKTIANEVYDLIVKFANYGFNRSHAVAYSVISYQLAYLKAKYPVYFMAALLSSSIGNEGKIAQYIKECREMGIQILPPSINKSGYTFLVENQSIRYSLTAIKGIGMTALKGLFSSRKTKKFTDLFDFCIRVSPKSINRKTLESLIHSGSFDEFGEDRAVLLASLDVALDHAQLVNPENALQGDLFSDDEFFLKPKYVEVDPIRAEDKLMQEKEVLGLYLSDHPVSLYEREAKFEQAIAISSISNVGKNVRVLVYVTELKKIRTKKGETMAFLTVSDQSGDLEAVVFPNVLKRYSILFQQGNILIFDGKIEERNGVKQLIISAAKEVVKHDEMVEGKNVLYLKIQKHQEQGEFLHALKKLLNMHSGETPVILYYEEARRSIRLGKEDYIQPTPVLLKEIKSLLGSDNVILK
ncbi:DNA polymerase III subunit alpha [Robertmurraya korlensis]|uniref:DNA polymerase III subunit alpha n=1 Tax=Robertmurraya korlensis TaxID=519977 RepID=UPI0008251DA6|nr:DNA polymerase III subunit alpha [Robertmurraya korlensis]